MAFSSSSHVASSALALFTFTVCLESSVALAASAARDDGESFEQAAAEYFAAHARNLQGTSDKNAFDARVAYEQLNTQTIPVWRNMDELMRGFLAVRDARFLEADGRPDFDRRQSWLYPDDGCFARAALMGQNLAHWGYARPAKVFSFGSLSVRTQNSPYGVVNWWYHVAPVVKVEDQLWVLDPAVEPKEPLRLDQWLLRQVSSMDKVQVSLCNQYTYEPDDSCTGATVSTESYALSAQVGFLDTEWRRQEELGRDPARVLGDYPPWE